MGNKFRLLGRWIIIRLIIQRVIIIEVRVIEVITRRVGFIELMVMDFIRFFIIRFNFNRHLQLVFYSM